MGLSKVTVSIGSGGLGRRAANEDKISGMIFYNDNLPSGFASNDREKKVFSLAEAEALGIAEGSANHDVEWYHISEYFRQQPEGELVIGFYDEPIVTMTFVELTTLCECPEAEGKLRQVAIYCARVATHGDFVTSMATVIEALVVTQETAGRPLRVILAADTSSVTAVTGWTSIGDLRALAAEHVAVVVGEDGGGAGKTLADAKSFSVTCVGAILGAVSKSPVHQSIGYVEKYNLSNGTELETPALGNGDLVSDLTENALGALKDDGYTFIRKYLPHVSGTYSERMPTAAPLTDDFAYFETGRVIDKAHRLIITKLTPYLNIDVLVDSDGKLAADTVEFFKDECIQTLEDNMEAVGNISGKEVIIDPDQNVLSTSKIIVTVKIQPKGIAEMIEVTIGLTTAVS